MKLFCNFIWLLRLKHNLISLHFFVFERWYGTKLRWNTKIPSGLCLNQRINISSQFSCNSNTISLLFTTKQTLEKCIHIHTIKATRTHTFNRLLITHLKFVICSSMCNQCCITYVLLLLNQWIMWTILLLHY